VAKRATQLWILSMNTWEFENEIGPDGFDYASFGLLNSKCSIVSNKQIPLPGIDLRLPTKAYTSHSLLVALQYGIYRFTSNDIFFYAIKTKQKNPFFKQERQCL